MSSAISPKKDECASDMAAQAVRNLIEEHHLDKNAIDFLLLCTQTPDHILPTTACIVQDKVGLPTSCAALDINQGCSGYIYGLSVASSLIASGNFSNVVLVTVDTYTKYIHPKDKGNLSIFWRCRYRYPHLYPRELSHRQTHLGY